MLTYTNALKYLKHNWFKSIGYSIFAFYILFHLLTLGISPLPWFDETFMASITDSLQAENTYHIKYAPFLQESEFLIYGPVYFLLQKLLLQVIGFGIYQFRLLNFIAGLCFIWLIYNFVKNHVSKATVLFIIIAILNEPVFARSLHSGRMDFVALFFLLLSYISYFLIDSPLRYKSILSVVTGALLALAMLTTPRIFFGFFFFVFQFFLHINNRKKMVKHFTIAFSFLVCYSIWVCTKFSSFSSFINIYLNNELVKEHLGADGLNFIRYKYHYIVWLVLLFSVLVLFLNRKNIHQQAKIILSIVIINIIAFHIAIAERGPYAALITPFYFIVIGFALDALILQYKKIKWRLIFYVVIVLPFALIFFIKLIAITISYSDRREGSVANEIARMIPANSNVIGTFDYYYLLHKNKIAFEEMEYYTNLEKMHTYQTTIFKYKFVIIRDNFTDSEVAKYYFAHHQHKLVAIIGNNRKLSSFEIKLDEILNHYFDSRLLSSYSGRIYQRID